MVGAHLGGIDHSYKKIKKTPARCLVCGEYSECQIIKYEESIHIFFIKVKVLAEQFWFDWEICNHRAVLFDKQDVARYKQEQIETGIMSVPYYQAMRLQMMAMPEKVSIVQIVLVLIATLPFALALVVLVKILLDILGISFVP